MARRDTQIISALDKVLSSHFAKELYSLSGYQECALCLEKSTTSWLVYGAERGAHFNEIKCESLLLACFTFINSITHKRDLIRKIENAFLETLTEQN